jgi:hypothetical protein
MKIPKPISAFIKATNTHNPTELIATFNDRSVISDEGREYRGTAAIKKWFEEKSVGANVSLEPMKTADSNGKTIVTMKVDGTFDKTGLPDPLLLDFHFKIEANQVAELSIRFADSID